MEDINERCRYTYYKLLRTEHIWMDSIGQRLESARLLGPPSASEYKKYNDQQRKLFRKQVELNKKVKKVCPEFMFKYPVRGFDLTKWSEVHNKTKQKVNQDFESQAP